MENQEVKEIKEIIEEKDVNQNEELLLKDRKNHEVIYIIYKITNKINNYYYIGFHKTYEGYEEIDGYMGSGSLIKAAVKKYGKENFIKEILFKSKNKDEAADMEEKLVVVRDENHMDSYNLVRGGILSSEEFDKKNNRIFSEEFREAVSKRFKGKPRSEEEKRRISKTLKGRKHSWQDKVNKNPEKIEKMRQKHLGMKRSEEACRNIKKGIHDSIEKRRENGTYVNSTQNKKIYHNVITNEERYFSDDEYNSLNDNENWKCGWSESHKKNIDKNQRSEHFKNRIFIHKDGVTKRVKKDELEKWIDDGWEIGRGYKIIHINDGKSVRSIKETDIEEWLNKGWVIGIKLNDYEEKLKEMNKNEGNNDCN
jgi:hypothetical protein